MSTDTLTEQLRKTYAKDFDSRFEKELTRPIEQAIYNAELFKPFINFTLTVPLSKDVITAFKAHETYAVVKDRYIAARLSAAATFIEQGANNGT